MGCAVNSSNGPTLGFDPVFSQVESFAAPAEQGLEICLTFLLQTNVLLEQRWPVFEGCVLQFGRSKLAFCIV